MLISGRCHIVVQIWLCHLVSLATMHSRIIYNKYFTVLCVLISDDCALISKFLLFFLPISLGLNVCLASDRVYFCWFHIVFLRFVECSLSNCLCLSSLLSSSTISPDRSKAFCSFLHPALGALVSGNSTDYICIDMFLPFSIEYFKVILLHCHDPSCIEALGVWFLE